MAYDGTIKFDTELDISKFQESADKLDSIVKSMSAFKTLESGFSAIADTMTDLAGSAVPNLTGAIGELIDSSNLLEGTIGTLKTALEMKKAIDGFTKATEKAANAVNIAAEAEIAQTDAAKKLLVQSSFQQTSVKKGTAAEALRTAALKAGLTVNKQRQLVTAQGVIVTEAEAAALFTSATAVSAKSIVVQLLTGQITLASAATQLWGKVMESSLGPIALVAGAIGAVVAVGKVVINNIEEQNAKYEALRINAEEVKTTFAEIDTTFQDTTKAAQGNAIIAETLVGRLEELEDAGLNTKAAHDEYRDTVDKLNRVMPELNAIIDEQTGLIEGGTEALENAVIAQRDYKISVAKMNLDDAKLEEFGNALGTVEEAYASLAAETAQRTAAFDELEGVLGRVISAEERETFVAGNLATEYLESNNYVLDERYDKIGELEYQINQLQISEANWNSQIAADTNSLIGLGAAAGLTAEQTQGYIDTVVQGASETSSAIFAMDEDQQAAYNEIQTSLTNLEAAYETSKASILDSVQSQMGLLDEYATTAPTNIQKVMDALASQEQYMLDYQTNMTLADAMGVSPELLAELSDGSEESAAILAGIVAAGTEGVDDLNAQYGRTREGQEEFSEQMALMDTNYDTEMDSIEARTVEFAENFNQEDKAIEGANATINGYINTLAGRIQELYNLGYELGSAGNNGYNDATGGKPRTTVAPTNSGAAAASYRPPIATQQTTGVANYRQPMQTIMPAVAEIMPANKNLVRGLSVEFNDTYAAFPNKYVESADELDISDEMAEAFINMMQEASCHLLDSRIQAMIDARGLEALAKQLETFTIKCDVLQSGLLFGEHYFLGDVIPIKLAEYGLMVAATVESVTRIYETGGTKVSVSLGKFEVI